MAHEEVDPLPLGKPAGEVLFQGLQASPVRRKGPRPELQGGELHPAAQGHPGPSREEGPKGLGGEGGGVQVDGAREVEDLLGGEALRLPRLGQKDVAPPFLPPDHKPFQLVPEELQAHLAELHHLPQDAVVLVPGVAQLEEAGEEGLPGVGAAHLQKKPPGLRVLGEGA